MAQPVLIYFRERERGGKQDRETEREKQRERKRDREMFVVPLIYAFTG